MSVEDKVATKIIDLATLDLPFTFDVQQSQDSYPLVITLLQTLNAISYNALKLPFFANSILEKELQGDEEATGELSKVVLKLSTEIHSILLPFISVYFFVKIQKRATDKDHQLGIIFNMKDNYYGIIPLPQGLGYKDLNINYGGAIPTKIDTIQDLLESSRVEANDNGDNRLENVIEIEDMMADFSMEPPSISEERTQEIIPTVSSKILNSPSNLENPADFLRSRYYSTLYSLNTPLNYFPKTALTRFRNLCGNDNGIVISILEKLFLPIDQMDIRHQGRFGLLKMVHSNNDNPIITDIHEIKSQKEFLDKHRSLVNAILAAENNSKTPAKLNGEISEVQSARNSVDEVNESKLQRLIIDLKMRESQLQTIIIFEMLLAWEIDETDFLAKNAKKQKKEEDKRSKEAKSSLVRKKKSKAKKKIIPTFLGMGVNVSDVQIEDKHEAVVLDQFTLYKTLNSIVDRMGLWDMLLGRAQNQQNDSSISFLAYVLVPYFNKKLPEIVKYVVDNVKGSNLKIVKNKAEKKLTSRDQSPMEEEISTHSENIVKDSQEQSGTKRKSKYNKVVLTRRVPKLDKASTSGLSEEYDLMPAFSLKRSSSNLSSKNFKKRLVDMSVSNGQKSSETVPTGNGSLAKRSKSLSDKSNIHEGPSFIFSNSKKIKGKNLSSSRSQSQTQVLATPMKSKSISVVPGTRIDSATLSKDENLASAVVNSLSAGSSRAVSQVESTPHNSVRVIDMSEVIKTPEDKFVRPTSKDITIPASSSRKQKSISNRLFSASLTVDHLNPITSSPVSKSPPMTSTIQTSISSPYTEVQRTPAHKDNFSVPGNNASSKSHRRAKPGEPISAHDSPFYNTGWDGSPMQMERIERSQRENKESVIESSPEVRNLVFSNNDPIREEGVYSEDSDDGFLSPKATATIRTYAKQKKTF
ncbi:DNA replication regulator SLD3-domain-containing protein [Scheffersomyces xylosifermentans]|uniref:DNA replication regulator SLD3-domain-containing protein n=1 Tax=Scheffersomyces xylosifermentans TaxID=1304137 RepID=UPI00315CCFEE